MVRGARQKPASLDQGSRELQQLIHTTPGTQCCAIPVQHIPVSPGPALAAPWKGSRCGDLTAFNSLLSFTWAAPDLWSPLPRPAQLKQSSCCPLCPYRSHGQHRR